MQTRKTRGWPRTVGVAMLAMLLAVALSSCSFHRLRPDRVASEGALPPGYIPRAPVVPPWGFIYTDYQAPLDIQSGHLGQPTSVANMKKGTSDEVTFIGLWPLWPTLTLGFGDCSIEDAASTADISRIHYADYEFFTVLFIYSRMKVNVYGE